MYSRQRENWYTDLGVKRKFLQRWLSSEEVCYQYHENLKNVFQNSLLIFVRSFVCFFIGEKDWHSWFPKEGWQNTGRVPCRCQRRLLQGTRTGTFPGKNWYDWQEKQRTRREGRQRGKKVRYKPSRGGKCYMQLTQFTLLQTETFFRGDSIKAVLFKEII